MSSNLNAKPISIFATTVGTILEWYDFMVFAYLVPIISTLFFPAHNKLVSSMATYAVFAVGFFIRPLGAAVFGHYGDRYGRKKILVFSMVLISISTTLMGLLPTYSQIGIAAPLLLILLRLIQGFCVGGETTGSASLLLELYPENYRGFLGSLMWAAVGIGMLLGSLVTSITLHVTTSAFLYTWGWRIPFLLGLLTGVIGYYVRQKIPESFLFYTAKTNQTLVRFPIRDVLIKHKRNIMVISGLYILSAMITYLLFVFMPTYATMVSKISFALASVVTTVAITCVTFLVPVTGYLSDKFGRKPCLLVGAIGFILLSYPLYLFISQQSKFHFVIAEGCFVILAALYQGTLTAAVQEIPVTAVRYTVTAISYNFSYALFGGTAPFIATYFVHLTGNPAAPGLYLVFGGLLALMAIFSMRETARLALR